MTEPNNQEQAEVFVFPASFAQQRLWFLHQLAPDNPFYNVATAIRLTGSLNLTALEQAFNEIVRRHETLRTTFLTIEGQLLQVIAPHLSISLPIVDLRHFSPTKREAEAQRLAIVEAQRSFNLSIGPLLRIILLQLSEKEYVLLLNLHHIVADGWSIGVLIKELQIFYTAFVDRKPSPLPELPIQYADFSEWQHQWLSAGVLSEQLNYWQQQLTVITDLNLPTDRCRTTIQTYRGARKDINLSGLLSEKIKLLCQRENVTLFMTLLAAFQTLIYHYTGQEDIAIGSPIANRNRSEVEGAIGFFVNSLVLRTDLSGNPTFRELLYRVKEVTIAAYSHQDLPFEKLVQELHPHRDLTRNPLFQVSFSLQNTPVEAVYLPELTLSLLDFDPGIAKLDLEVNFWEELETIKGQVTYNTDLFDDITIERMLGHLQRLLESIVTNPEQRLSQLSFLTAEERKKLLFDWNNTLKEFPNLKCFNQMFESQIKLYPDTIAIIFDNQILTYRQLNDRANQLAHHLQKLGVFPDVIVGICLERSINAIVSVLAVLKAGGAYLPLDPTYPQERLNFMLKEAKTSVIVTESNFLEIFSDLDELPIICLDKDWQNIVKNSKANLANNMIQDNLAYVIYTSGSTGNPKGVQIQHRGLSNLIQAQIEIFNIQPHHRILQFASLSFDASIFEIVMALATGAALCLAKKEDLLPGKSLLKLLQNHAITHVTLPPAVLSVLPKDELPELQVIICAGECCSQEIVKKWADGRRFFNAYGPTEATVWATIAEIKDDSKKIPIGRPIPNAQVYILDKYLQPVPIGIPGELYIGGDGVAKGYLNLPELTAERFISNPFIKSEGKETFDRIYKTGDLARYLPDSNIEFLGRIDEQVKIRGFRIELGEIEAVLRQHSAVKETVVIARDKNSNEKQLIAYIVPEKEKAIVLEELRKFLQNKLPDYMIPAAFVCLDSLPLTPNGKVDRHNLPNPEPAINKVEIPPRNYTESILVKIWTEILNIERVSVNDNFFDLGGDSLLSIQILDKIERQFQVKLPLSHLFLHPTIESLANSLNTSKNCPEWSPLVAIQPKGTQPPFFCIHPIFGVVFPYYELAYNLESDRPFYGMQPLGIDGEKTPLNRIQDMASYYIQAMRAVQPIGPYFIGGWSFGGLVAFEIAQQLQKSGQEVGLLAIIDTFAPINQQKFSLWYGLNFLFFIAIRHGWGFVKDYFSLLTAFDRQKSQLMSKETRQRLLKELTSKSILRVFQANSQAAIDYQPQVYHGKLTLFKSSDRVKFANQDTTMGWRKLAGNGVEVKLVPGNHLTMLRKPNAQVFAEQLKECLDRSERG